MIGCGTVGEGVVRLLTDNAALYEQRLGARLGLRRVLVRNLRKADRPAGVSASLLTDNPDSFFDAADMPIVIEAAGGRGVVSGYVTRALEMGKHVVTANKMLLAAEGPELFALARKKNVSIAFEASCGGAIPLITGLQFGLMSNRIEALYGILNGTSNYILTQMTQAGKPYAVALKEAQSLGFAEADPTLDVSGRDAAQKLAVIASLAFGIQARGEQVWCEGIDRLDLADIRFGSELGYEIKLLAIGQRNDDGCVSLRVHPSFVHAGLPLAQVHGAFNALSVYGHAAGHTMFLGRGAGSLPTAGAVVSDLLNVASGWYPVAFSRMNLWCDRHPPVKLVDPNDLVSRYYIRLNARDVPGVMAKVAMAFGDSGISLSAVMQHESAVGQFVPVVITTHQARRGAVRSALAKIEQLDVIDGNPVCIHIVDMPAG
jgi:homoserine dehydrogenase